MTAAAANLVAVTVVRTARDAHGDETVSSEHVIAGCVLAPVSQSEDVSRGEQITGQWRLYQLPADADVRASDRLRLSTDPTPPVGAALKVRAPYQVIGDPERWASPWSSWTPGLVVTIRRVSG